MVVAVSEAELAAAAAETGTAEDTVTAALGAVLVGGVYADGWAHFNVAGLESIFTPWHAVLYGGFLLLVAWMAVLLLRRRTAMGRWVVPSGYGWGWIGVAVFALGGFGDMAWHLAFGAEVGINALISPAHLLLLSGGILMITSPVRTATRSPWSRRRGWPAVIALAAATALVGFFLSYVSVFVDPAAQEAIVLVPEAAPGHRAAEMSAIAGLNAYLVTTVLLVVPVLFLRRNRLLPPAALTVLVAAVALPAAALTNLTYWAPAVAAVGVAGLLDVLLTVGPDLPDTAAALLLPLAVWGGQLLAMASSGDLRWPAELWAGVVLLSLLAALSLAQLTQPRTGSSVRS